MPVDYASTARALSLPDSPSPLSPSNETTRVPWARTRRSFTSPIDEAVGLRDRMINHAAGLSRRLQEAWQRMNVWQKIGAVALVIAIFGLGLGLMFLTGKIFIWLGPVAEKWEKSNLAYFILWLCVFFVSFPPLIGWSTFGTVAGFVFGIWKGWFLFTCASILGSTCSFVISRTVLSKFVARLMERDKRFAALSLTLKYDGLLLLCMIRLCPLPYSICNGAVSTFPTVHPLMYGLATAIISPKFLVPTFIGSRLRILSEKNEVMSAGSKAVNICSIIITIAIGIFTGLYIYKRTLARAKQLEAEERAEIRQSLRADHAAHHRHPAFSDDPDVNTAATVLARDEEEQIGFNDEDEDNVHLDLADDSAIDSPKARTEGPYQDDFTDDDSDVFRDGDDTDSEAYGLHSHIRTNPNTQSVSN